MSHEYAQGWALPSSFGLEVEARRLHATAGPAGLGDVAPAVAVSAFPKAFDAFVCLAAAIVVFPQMLFPGLERSLAVFANLAVCSLAYLTGPLGGLVFRAVDRRHGCGVRLTAARFLLGAATAGVAFLPSGGLGVLFLVACRLAQGFAMGGVRGQAPALDQLNLTREGRLGLTLARGLAAAAALVLAGAIFAVFRLGVSATDFLAWGWRYPFLLGVAANIVALFADLRLLATDDREQASDRPVVRLAAVDGAPVD